MSTQEVAAFFCVSRRLIQKMIKEGKIDAVGGEVGIEAAVEEESDKDRSWYQVDREEVKRLVEDLPPLLPLKALRKIQGRHHKTQLEKRLYERAVEAERRLWEGRAKRWRETLKRSVYGDVELLLDERTTVMEWGYIAQDGVPISVSLDPCPLCNQRMDVPPKSTARERAAVLRSHLLATHPLEEPLAQ